MTIFRMIMTPVTPTTINDRLLTDDLLAFWDALGADDLRLVGGCVRDAVLGIEAHDLDFATPLRPEDIMRRARASGMKAIPTGIEHGTVTVIHQDIKAEITTLRRDIQANGRYALIAYTDDWALDAMRRDFTINALSMDRAGHIHDYAGGLDDLAAQRVRFIGDADQRIREDYLRIMRFFRFHARFGGDTADIMALTACRNGRDGLTGLSIERVRDELLRLLSGPRPIEMLGLMQEAGILPIINISLTHLDRLARVLDYPLFTDGFWRLRALLPDDADHLHAAARHWRLPNRVLRDWLDVLSLMVDDPADFRHGVYHAGIEAGQRALALVNADTADMRRVMLQHVRHEKLPIDGRDITELAGLTGPVVGDVLKKMEYWWLDTAPAADRATCLQKLQEFSRK